MHLWPEWEYLSHSDRRHDNDKNSDVIGVRMEKPEEAMVDADKALQCTRCRLGSIFTSQPNKLRHTLKVVF